MSNITLILVQVSLCFGISMAVIALLRRHLIDVLTDTCGTPKRAAFWLMFTQLMLVIAPLLLVIFFTDAKPGINDYPAAAIKDTLFQSLFGIFIAISMVGRVIWKSATAEVLPGAE
ncbi:MAG TPA: hypothetical protein ENJ80_07650 [Gammaproteobacteria bacterium]|nr:hypothetical protein [Gammaproteobacteria bacterium]